MDYKGRKSGSIIKSENKKSAPIEALSFIY